MLRAVTYGSNGFVAVGTRIWGSPEGVAWSKRQDVTTAALGAAAFGNGQYLVAGLEGTLLLSDDGVRWQARSADVHPGYHAACAAAGRFVATGWGGAIVLSEQ